MCSVCLGIRRLRLVGGLAILALLMACQSPNAQPAGGAATKATSAPETRSAASPAAKTGIPLKDSTKYLDESLASLQRNDVAAAKKQYGEYDENWDKIEDGVKAKSPDIYKKIEDAMGDVKGSLVTSASPDTAKATEALNKLKKTINDSLPSL